MSFSRKVPVLAASVAAAALLVAAPASAQTSMKLTSNKAGSNMMAKTGPAPDARTSTATQAPGGDKGGSLMAKAGNQLK